MKVALLIGINYSNDPASKLNGCINDIDNINEVLIKQYGYESSNIIMLRDDNPSKMPTRNAILAAFQNIVNASKSNLCTEIWIHYSGHGTVVIDRNGDEVSGRDSAIVPVDFKTSGLIVDDTILQFLSQIQCPTIIMMDSCNSGTVCDLEWSFEYDPNTDNHMQVQNKTVLSLQNENITMFSGCKDTQTSADFYDTADRRYEGAFTDALLLSLSKTSYVGTVSTIHKDICLSLKSRGFSQTPILSGSSTKVILSKFYISPTIPPLITPNKPNRINRINRPNRFNWRPTLPTKITTLIPTTFSNAISNAIRPFPFLQKSLIQNTSLRNPTMKMQIYMR